MVGGGCMCTNKRAHAHMHKWPLPRSVSKGEGAMKALSPPSLLFVYLPPSPKAPTGQHNTHTPHPPTSFNTVNSIPTQVWTGQSRRDKRQSGGTTTAKEMQKTLSTALKKKKLKFFKPSCTGMLTRGRPVHREVNNATPCRCFLDSRCQD